MRGEEEAARGHKANEGLPIVTQPAVWNHTAMCDNLMSAQVCVRVFVCVSERVVSQSLAAHQFCH